jgi:O-antigen biosynthesis protein WbqP
MTRIFDIFFSFFGLLILSPVILLLLIIGFFDTGSPLFWQERLGVNQKPFYLVKFRSMHIHAPSVATHLASVHSITPFGRFLRKSKLDELPQLWNVFMGDMSLVGPRPNLFNQIELIEEREKRGVYSIRPGITGLAQINKIDMSTPQLLAETDARMVAQLNLLYYFKYIVLTVFGKGFGDRIVNQK